jgi:DNA-binding PadR family transcriptional regulator
MSDNHKPPTPRQIWDVLRRLERKGLVEKQRDALGNVVKRRAKSGRLQTVWVRTDKDAARLH